MDQGDCVIFTSLEEEAGYWKKIAQKYTEEKENVQRDYDDFVNDSQQLEKEYEVTIEQNENTIRALRSCVNRIQMENESYKKKSDTVEIDNMSLLTKLNESKDDNCRLKKYIRELEQKNDDLERAERTFAESVAGVEASLNSLLERNAMLESEIDEKETLKVKLQRLVDETRDLKQELQLKERCPDNDRSVTTNGHATEMVDSNRCNSVAAVQTQTTPLKRDSTNINNVNGSVESPFSPSTRILALNIVGDLLRKVGNLEAKLNSTNYGYRDNGENTRNRHRSRGRTSSAVQNYNK